ncbi:hypothetical protein VNO77_16177 [Canavalia gladiata]|uniref:Uncharacterized protein n=1 Tax=Canavalia gladiata TaxID=3824 RepID=A0AAN9QRV7_CANGL
MLIIILNVFLTLDILVRVRFLFWLQCLVPCCDVFKEIISSLLNKQFRIRRHLFLSLLRNLDLAESRFKDFVSRGKWNDYGMSLSNF